MTVTEWTEVAGFRALRTPVHFKILVNRFLLYFTKPPRWAPRGPMVKNLTKSGPFQQVDLLGVTLLIFGSGEYQTWG
jgi:hypothetical protein